MRRASIVALEIDGKIGEINRGSLKRRESRVDKGGDRQTFLHLFRTLAELSINPERRQNCYSVDM
jgi:hypothetical protein